MAIFFGSAKELEEKMGMRKRESFEDMSDRLSTIMMLTIFGVVTVAVLAGGVFCVVSLVR